MLRNAIIHGGTFVHTSASSTSEGFNILHRNIAAGAFHDSGERFDPPKCHPNTRVAVLKEIMQWIQAIEKSEDVLWLYGSAGAGKSAIAQTIAEMCAKLSLIVASFFFSRTSHSRNNEKRLISSIAYQLAISIPSTRSYVESAVQIDPAIFDKSLETQIETLIIGPLENACANVNPAAAKQWPRLIIIDGLDECDGTSIQCSIIRILSKALRLVPVPLILLVASRPEPHIRNTFNLLIKSESHVSRHLVLDDSYEPDADIKEFLISRFNEIKENYPFSAYIPESWPSEEIVDRLVRKSSGQFIYASTVMKYLDSPNHRPMRRLDVIIGLRPVDGDMPYKELDALYGHIFSCVKNFATTTKMLGFLLFRQWYRLFTPGYLGVLVGLDEEDVYLHLSELHSILYIPPPDFRLSEIRPTHASLQDFLVDRQRSGQYFLDEEAFHTGLTQQCVRHISTLSMNQVFEEDSNLGEYLRHAFIRHCIRASIDSIDLKNDLMQLCDLGPWFKMALPNLVSELSALFAWLYKADTAAKELSSHIQSLLDQYLTTELNKHTFNGSNVDIAGLLLFPAVWNWRWFSLFSGVSQVPKILNWPTYRDRKTYQHLLSQFFEDKNRSGKYHVDGIVYAYAALECLQNMVNLNEHDILHPYPFIGFGIERPNAEFTRIISPPKTVTPHYRNGVKAVTKLLSKAAPLTDLYSYLRDHPLQNPAKAEVHCEHGFASLRLAVEVYLEKCNHLVSKVI